MKYNFIILKWSINHCWLLILSSGHTGKRFILMIPESGSSVTEVPIEVIISTEHDTNVSLTSPYPGVSRTLTVQPPGTKITLPPGIALRGTGIQQKGILVESSMDVSVYVFHEDGYYALPSRYLMKPNLRYRVTDSGGNPRSICAIAPINSAAKVEYIFQKNGTAKTVNIPMFSVFYLRSVWPMTDVIVTSDAPIAVIAGHYEISIAPHQTLMGYLLPMSYWDKSYILPPIENATNKNDVMYPIDGRSTSYRWIRNSIQSSELEVFEHWDAEYSTNVNSHFIQANDSISMILWQDSGGPFQLLHGNNSRSLSILQQLPICHAYLPRSALRGSHSKDKRFCRSEGGWVWHVKSKK